MGGWVLVKWVKIRKVEAAEPVAPLVLGELFQCDRRAFAITLAGVFVTLGLLTALFSRESHVPFFAVAVWTVWNALVPVIFLAVRATTGKLRELFLSILLGLVLLDVVFAIGVPLGGRIGNQIYCFSALARHRSHRPGRRVRPGLLRQNSSQSALSSLCESRSGLTLLRS